jgi:hypothetical protein
MTEDDRASERACFAVDGDVGPIGLAPDLRGEEAHQEGATALNARPRSPTASEVTTT